MHILDNILPLINKAGRYINREYNSIYKSPDGSKTRVCLVYPDAYEIGMSNLGLRIIYHILNNRADVVAERVFSPWIDMEAKMREKGEKLRSLESQSLIGEFDILGFSVQYELCYTNILNILNLSGIPFRNEEREKGYPLIIAGGPCVINPEPLKDFFDIFVIGEGEEVINEIVDTYNLWKTEGGSKKDLLTEMSKIQGIYVPLIHDSMRDLRIKRRIIENLDTAYFPTEPVVPYLNIIHDRITIEVARGCLHGCRFCQAGMMYRPMRERSPERIIEIAKNSVKSTGWEEISLCSLHTGDYSCLEKVVKDLADTYEGKGIGISFSSLRPGNINEYIITQILRLRKVGMTFAPEAGSERLRSIINKKIDRDEIFQSAEILYKAGWNNIKLYFMVGLPLERDEDIEEIINLTKEISMCSRKLRGKKGMVTVNVTSFVPKPHTPFQWHGQESLGGLKDKIGYLRDRVHRQGFTFKWQGVELSLLEAAFARGDRHLGRVIEEAWREGCRFDGWSECFRFDKWLSAFSTLGIDPTDYANREIGINEPLCWDYVDTGVSKPYLMREFLNSKNGKNTEDCLDNSCTTCGACDSTANIRIRRWDDARNNFLENNNREIKDFKNSQIKHKIRTVFCKTGIMRFISHLDLIRLFTRALRRAEIPVAYSKGFNPQPKMSLGPPLPVGYEGEKEWADFDLEKFMDVESFIEKINRTLPSEIKFLQGWNIDSRTPSLCSVLKGASYLTQLSHSLLMKNNSIIGSEILNPEFHIEKIRELLRQESLFFEVIIDNKKSMVDIKPLIYRIELIGCNDFIEHKIEMKIEGTKGVGPEDIICKMYDMSREGSHFIQVKRKFLFSPDEYPHLQE